MTQETLAVAVQGVAHRYGEAATLEAIDFAVKRGEFVGVLGVNGAGKSTMLRCVAGCLCPDEGTVQVFGHPAASRAARAQLGYASDAPLLYPELTLRESLQFAASIRGLHGRAQTRALDELISQFELAEALTTRGDALSRGFRQRAGLAQALLGDPPLLLLDEPTSGLDPVSRTKLRELLKAKIGKHTILLSSHLLDDVALLCDRCIVLHRGRLIHESTGQPTLPELERLLLTSVRS